MSISEAPQAPADLLCERCGGPRRPGSARMCRACYEKKSEPAQEVAPAEKVVDVPEADAPEEPPPAPEPDPRDVWIEALRATVTVGEQQIAALKEQAAALATERDAARARQATAEKESDEGYELLYAALEGSPEADGEDDMFAAFAQFVARIKAEGFFHPDPDRPLSDTERREALSLALGLEIGEASAAASVARRLVIFRKAVQVMEAALLPMDEPKSRRDAKGRFAKAEESPA